MSYGLPQPETQANSQLAITICSFCQTQLSYPINSFYIQCPKCTNTMNPRAPNLNFVNCVNCSTLLSHPPSSSAIQCPKCEIIMSLPERPMEMPAPISQSPQQPVAPPPPRTPGPSSHSASAASSANSAHSRKLHKKRKDPNAPKRASNAYMIFCKERRAQLKLEHPDLPFGKVGAQLGEMWRNFSAEEKKPYEDRAAGDRDRYKRDMETYQTDSSGAPSESPKEKKIKTEIKKPRDSLPGSVSTPSSAPPPPPPTSSPVGLPSDWMHSQPQPNIHPLPLMPPPDEHMLSTQAALHQAMTAAATVPMQFSSHLEPAPAAPTAAPVPTASPSSVPSPPPPPVSHNFFHSPPRAAVPPSIAPTLFAGSVSHTAPVPAPVSHVGETTAPHRAEVKAVQ